MVVVSGQLRQLRADARGAAGEPDEALQVGAGPDLQHEGGEGQCHFFFLGGEGGGGKLCCPNGNFSHGKFGSLSPRKASCNSCASQP